MVWPRFKVFWFSRDNPVGHSERKRKKRQIEEEVGKQCEKVDSHRIANSARVAENSTRWKGIASNLFLVPDDLRRLWDRIKYCVMTFSFNL